MPVDELPLAPPSSTRCEGGAASPNARLSRFSAQALAALLATYALNAGCSSSSAPPAATGTAGQAAGSHVETGGAGGAAGSGKLSFATDVYERVIRLRCASCHSDAPSFGGLAFFPGGPATAYANLVNVPAGAESNYLCHASGLMRVKPGDPEHSLIYLKLTMPPCGSKMPPAAFAQANDEQVNLVRQWIMDGAAP